MKLKIDISEIEALIFIKDITGMPSNIKDPEKEDVHEVLKSMAYQIVNQLYYKYGYLELESLI